MLAAMAGDDLPAADRALLQNHLADCAACRTELAQLEAVVRAVRMTPDVDPPAWLVTRVMARVRDEAVHRRSWLSRLFLPLHIKLPLEGFALLMICVIAWYVMQDMDRSHQLQSGAPTTQVQPGELNTAAPAVTSPPVERRAPTPMTATPHGDTISPPKTQEPPFAPSFARPLQPNSELLERSKAEHKAPAAAPTGREQSGGTAVERSMAAKAKSENADRSLAAPVRLSVRVRVAVDDRVAFGDTLQLLVQRTGGVLLASSPGTATIRIDGARLPGLLERLAQLGRILERPGDNVPSEGELELQLVW